MPITEGSTAYEVRTLDGNEKGFRSLAAAVKYSLDRGWGTIEFPNYQSVIVAPQEDFIQVEHQTHASEGIDWEERIPLAKGGLNKVAQVVKRFRPGYRIEVVTAEDLGLED